MKKITVMVLLLFLNLCSIQSISASEYENDDTLDLNTEDIKNKGEDYSSLTDMNGLNLFTDKMKFVLEYEKEKDLASNEKMQNVLFTNHFSNLEENEDDKDMIFKEPVSFDKIAVSKQEEISLAPFFVAVTILLSVLMFMLTRKRYKRRESKNLENYSNVYE